MYNLLKELFPICRSITGDGFRKSLEIIKQHIPINSIEVPSGTQAFDWQVPFEWNIKDAWIKNGNGEKIIKFEENNLHVVGYSIPVDKKIDLKELSEHLFTLPSQPDAIPYVTSYYKERWGFCISQKQYESLQEDEYHVFIDSKLEPGSLTYGELYISGDSKQEVFVSTYLCHPSMANNELSGPVLTVELVKYIMSMKNKQLSYRIVFIPETIGSLVYLSKNLFEMKNNIVAGFNITCVGDERAWSFLPSRHSDTLADRAALKVLEDNSIDFTRYSFLERGSDERQYCSPGVDLPVVSIMRSKYGTYPEYHTSLDDLNFVTQKGLSDSLEIYKQCVDLLEANKYFKTTCLGEPQLGKRGLYPTISQKGSCANVRDMMNFLAYLDGKNDLISICNLIGISHLEAKRIALLLLENNLIKESEE